MNTLIKEPLCSLLQSLFAQAENTTNDAFSQIQSMPERERQYLLHSKESYRQLYGEMLKELWLPVSQETAQLLYLLARSCRAKHIVEFGTSFGISTLHLAAALKDNCVDQADGGKVITTEFETNKAKKAWSHFEQAELTNFIELREGDALQTLAQELPEPIDMLILDGAKPLYCEILNLVEPYFRKGSLIISDDSNMSPEFMAYIKSQKDKYLSLPFGDDVEITVKL